MCLTLLKLECVMITSTEFVGYFDCVHKNMRFQKQLIDICSQFIHTFAINLFGMSLVVCTFNYQVC